MALAFPVEKNSEEASLGLAQHLLERRTTTLAGTLGCCGGSFHATSPFDLSPSDL
jgi:hypothetical protein